MKVTIEFDSLEEALPFLQATYPTTPVGDGGPPARADVNPVNIVDETPKRKRRTKAEMAAAAIEAQVTTAAPDPEGDDEPVTVTQTSEFEDAPPADDFLDDEPAAPVKQVTKDDVRAALVGYQERLSKGGKNVEEARSTVLALLKKVSGADKLGELAADKFAAVIDAANKAK